MTKKEMWHDWAKLCREKRQAIIQNWQDQLKGSARAVIQSFGEEKAMGCASELLDGLLQGVSVGDNLDDVAYEPLVKRLRQLSRELTAAKRPPGDVAVFVLSLKEVLLPVLQDAYPKGEELAEAVIMTDRLINKLAMITFETYVDAREKMIREQQRALVETAAPVVQVWDRILMVPLIGILDSERTMQIMDKMLTGIEQTQSRVVILDITGIPTVDTLVARHLISTATAVRLMGAECVITGVSARIAQTVVQMGIDLTDLNTKGSMADGLREAFAMVGMKIMAR